MQQLPIQTLPLAKPAAAEDSPGRTEGSSSGPDDGFDRALRQANDESGRGRQGEPSARETAAHDRDAGRRNEDGRGKARPESDPGDAPAQDASRRTARGEPAEARSGDTGESQSAAEKGRSALRPGSQTASTVDGGRLAGGTGQGGPGEGLRVQLRALLAEGGATVSSRQAAEGLRGGQSGREPAAADRAAQLRALLGGQSGNARSGGTGNGQSSPASGLSTGLTAAALAGGGNGEGQANGAAGHNGQQGISREALMRLLQGGQPVHARSGANGAQTANQSTGQNGGTKAQASAEALEGLGRDASARTDSGSATNQSGQVSRGLESQGPRPAQASQSVPKAMVQVAREAADGQREVRLKLHPPHLGQVRVELQMTDNRVQAIFHVDNRQAASMLDGQMHQLRTALQDQQLELEGSQVHLGDPGSGGDPRQFADDRPGEGDDRGWGRWRAFGGDDGAADGDPGGGGGPAEPVRGLNLYA